ncbi:MAG: glycosyl transferase family 4 [Nanoarchaeota archaeon]
MVDFILILPLLVSFLVTFFSLGIWILKARSIGLEWEDMNKLHRRKVAGSGGIMVLLGFLLGALLYVAYKTFFLQADNLSEILALLLVVVFASGIGFIDDLLGWRSGGLSRKSRLTILLFVSVPLIAINAGRSDISIPLFGNTNLGLLYALVAIPIGIMGATSTYNFLAGYNGLEAGQGILILSSLGIVAFFTNHTWLSVIAFCMVAALIAFLLFNFFPAQVFPGDALTYAVGSLIAGIAILGNFEKVALFFFIPYILETVLKSRGKLVKYSFGKPQKDGTLNEPYDKIYGLEHLAIRILKKINVPSTEKNVVFLLWSFQVFIIVLGFILFRDGIFNA